MVLLDKNREHGKLEMDPKVKLVLEEIIQSEKKYVKTLNTIVEVSLKCLS